MFPRLSRIIVVRFTLSTGRLLRLDYSFVDCQTASIFGDETTGSTNRTRQKRVKRGLFVQFVRGRCKLRGFWYADKCKKLDDAWRMPRSIFARNSATKVYSGEFFFAVWRGSLRWNDRNALQPTYLTISSRFNVR